MKRFIAVLLSAALIVPAMTAPAMAQSSNSQQEREQSHRQGSHEHQGQDGHRDHKSSKTGTKPSYKTFKKGEKFDKRYAKNYSEIDYRKYKTLKAPPKGYHYVRSGNDILLVAITSGIIASVLTGAMR